MIYWPIFIVWIAYAFFLKKGSKHHFSIAFTLFLLAAVLKIFSFDKIAQFFFSFSLLGWLIGITTALIEYQKAKLTSHA